MPDGDLLRADEDVFDEEPQDALALWDTGGSGAGSQLGEESFQAIGEFEVGLLVGKLGVQGFELATEASFAGTQVRYPGPQLVDGDQLLASPVAAVIHRPASESTRPEEGDQAAMASPASDQDDP